jgi:GntR family transcriptional regulator, carbon starvation induced regulator
MSAAPKLSPAVPTDPEPVAKETLASTVYGQLRREILTVELPPDAKLNIRGLCERFSVVPIPFHKALSRLSRENLVRQTDHRGFAVAPVSKADLRDLTKARCAIDGMALRQSIESREQSWEEQLLVSYHRLFRTPRFDIADAKLRSPAWEEAHRQFHAALVAGCGSRWLMNISAQLFEAAERYRHLGRLAGKSRAQADEHRPIMEAALAYNADLATGLLARHYQTTAELVETVLTHGSSNKT